MPQHSKAKPKMNTPTIGNTYVSNAIPNPDSQWRSRITWLEIQEKGFRFQREHPYHQGEVIFLTHQAFESSLWVEFNTPTNYEI